MTKGCRSILLCGIFECGGLVREVLCAEIHARNHANKILFFAQIGDFHESIDISIEIHSKQCKSSNIELNTTSGAEGRGERGMTRNIGDEIESAWSRQVSAYANAPNTGSKA
jgi:hypothetical protein